MVEPVGAEATVVGWDVGGAHVKACLLQRGEVQDAAQWPCPLWQGTVHLERVLELAAVRWPGLRRARHAVTMTGEMVDHFAHREDGVRRLAALLGAALPGARFFAGEAGWVGSDDAAAHWPRIASANWLATALHAARVLGDRPGVLVDIGSTTTDLVPFRAGRVLAASRSDAQRLARGELVYQGVVRTPLCALGPRVRWRGETLNVMNEFFASTADVYRLTGELDPLHDQHPGADQGPKDAPGSRARLARMIGLDAHDASDDDWLGFAREWRAHQVDELRGQLARVCADQQLDASATLVGAGCGAFLLHELAAPGQPCLAYASAVARIGERAAPQAAAWAQVGAPAVAVAALYDGDTR